MAAKKQVTKAKATLALAGDDNSVTVFLAALTQTPALASALSTSLTQLQSDLNQIITVLTYPKTVSDDLNSLGTVLSTTSSVLTAVSIIPEIGAEVEIIQEAVQSLQAELSSATTAANNIENEVKPIRDALSQLSSVLGDAIQGANDIASTSQGFLTNFTAVNNCINALPDGPVKTQGLEYLSSFAATTTPFDTAMNTALSTVNGVIGSFYGAITAVTNQLNFMTQITGAIDSLLSELSPLLGPLKSLQNLLNVTITIPTPVPFYGVHVSIADILTDFKAFTDLAMSILAPVLDPILDPLRQLAQSIIGQIPGIGELLSLSLNLPSIPDFPSLFGNLTVLLTQLEGALQVFNLDCPPKARQASFAVQLAKHMEEVTPYFEHGAAYSINLSPKKHLTVAGGKVAVSSDPAGKSCRFRAQIDLSKRVVFTASNRKLLAVQKGALVLIKGPVTKAAHFKVVAKGPKKFALKGPGNRVITVDGLSEIHRQPALSPLGGTGCCGG